MIRSVSFFFTALVVIFSSIVGAQQFAAGGSGGQASLINVNPDPNGEPWIAGGISRVEWEQSIARLPELVFRGIGSRAPAADKADNTLFPAFRPIFNQKGGSCAQASSVGYVFTYEINTVRKLAANVMDNQYPYDYSYNFVNSGSGSNGSMPNQGYELAQKTGIPNATVYGGFGLGKHDVWVSGYNVYYNGMANRADTQFTIKVNTPTGITAMREWLHNHQSGAEQGGCLVFCYNSSGCQTVSLATGTPEAGKKALVSFGTTGGHAVSIAGYNDSVRYDYNNDGKYTNDVDINSDGKVDVLDWEIGAVLMVNSWGTSFGNSGKIYVMYKMCADSAGMWSGTVYGMKTGEPFVKPKLTYKVTITHSLRNSIRVQAGISNTVSATAPTNRLSWGKAFNYAGGAYPMCGISGPSTIEIGLDVTDLVSQMTGKQAKFFLQVDSKGGIGTVDKFSLMDYTGGSAVETVCDKQNVTINPGTSSSAAITYLSIVFSGEQTPVSKKADVSTGYDLRWQGSGVQFTVPENSGNSLVNVALYNLHGRRVCDVVNNIGHGGVYTVDMTGKERLCAGMYLCTVKAAGFSKTIEVILTK